MVTLTNYLIVGGILFVLGAIGFLARRNLITMMLSAEMMLHGVSLNLVAFSNFHQNFQGQAFTVFILTVAACEAGIALALILALYQRHKTLDVSIWSRLGEEDVAQQADTDNTPPTTMPVPQFPQLTPSGRIPALPNRLAVGVSPPVKTTTSH